MPTPKKYVATDGAVTWHVRFRANGRQTSLPFRTLPEAQRFARDVENHGGAWAFDNYQRAQELAAEMTLDEWATRWFDSVTVSPGTLTNYRRDWRLRWKPHLGHMKLSQITREDVARALKAQKGADKTISNAWGTLASLLKGAVVDGHIDRSPHLGVKLPRRTEHEREEHRYLTAKEMQQVVEDTPARYKPLVWMLIGTGMRWSEATALTVADVDLERSTVKITKAWKQDRQKKVWYVGPPKTRKARRTITLPNETVDAIRPLVEGRKRTELLFANRNGEHVKHQPFYREIWREHCVKNIPQPRPRIHDLRHSHVAVLIAAGVSLPVIQARLGHEKITTTIDTYGHLLPDLQVAAADAASKVFAERSPRAELG